MMRRVGGDDDDGMVVERKEDRTSVPTRVADLERMGLSVMRMVRSWWVCLRRGAGAPKPEPFKGHSLKPLVVASHGHRTEIQNLAFVQTDGGGASTCSCCIARPLRWTN